MSPQWAFALTSSNFSGPEVYPITVTGNSPNPSTFPGSSSGTEVEIGVGDYTVYEQQARTSALQSQLQAINIITTTTAEGDCTPNFNVNQVFQDATWTMTSGDSQEGTLINKITISNGVVPTT